MNMATFFDQTKWYSTQKKRLFQMAYFKFHEKKYWESTKLTDSKINPSRENHAHFIPCKPPHKNHPKRVLWAYTLIHSNRNISCLEISNFISCVSFEHHCSCLQTRLRGFCIHGRKIHAQGNPHSPWWAWAPWYRLRGQWLWCWSLACPHHLHPQTNLCEHNSACPYPSTT